MVAPRCSQLAGTHLCPHQCCVVAVVVVMGATLLLHPPAVQSCFHPTPLPLAPFTPVHTPSAHTLCPLPLCVHCYYRYFCVSSLTDTCLPLLLTCTPGRPQPAPARVVDPKVDKLKLVCKAAGITISPSIYKQVRRWGGVHGDGGGFACGCAVHRHVLSLALPWSVS